MPINRKRQQRNEYQAEKDRITVGGGGQDKMCKFEIFRDFWSSLREDWVPKQLEEVSVNSLPKGLFVKGFFTVVFIYVCSA